MTRGPILQLLIAFALPLMLGNVFQMLYNTVDSVIVGPSARRWSSASISARGIWKSCTTPWRPPWPPPLL